MTPRRLGDPIPLAPMPPEEALSLRVDLRKDHPPAYIRTDPSAWFWLSPIIIESPGPLPSRRFDHVAKILTQPALGELETIRRN
jgi:hypothetical protein